MVTAQGKLKMWNMAHLGLMFLPKLGCDRNSVRGGGSAAKGCLASSPAIWSNSPTSNNQFTITLHSLTKCSKVTAADQMT